MNDPWYKRLGKAAYGTFASLLFLFVLYMTFYRATGH